MGEEGRMEGEVEEGAWDLGEEGEAEDTFLRELGDIRHNPEEGCRVLQVSSAAWSVVPPVMGRQLRSVGLSVSGVGMRWEGHTLTSLRRYHKLSLELGTSLGVVRVVVEQVTSLRVVPWWAPTYPEQGEVVRAAPATLVTTADPWDS